jgi:thiol:disulfide interchange protein DsbA
MKPVSRWLLAITALFSTALIAATPADRGPGFIEGIEYQRVVPEQPTTVAKGKIEVVELFWYGCPHCYRLEPTLKKWLKNKPANVVFFRIPATFNKLWNIHAQAYITASIMGVVEKTHQAFFDSIHKLKKRLDTPQKIADFYASHGVDRKQFLSVFNSFAVKAKLARYRNLMEAYGAKSVPTIVINGKYRTTATMAGGTHEALIRVINYLVAMESKAGS